MKNRGIDIFISSPYKRSVLNIGKLVNFNKKEVVVYENLKECRFSRVENCNWYTWSCDELF